MYCNLKSFSEIRTYLAKGTKDILPEVATVYGHSTVRKRWLFKQVMDHLKPEEN